MTKIDRTAQLARATEFMGIYRSLVAGDYNSGNLHEIAKKLAALNTFSNPVYKYYGAQAHYAAGDIKKNESEIRTLAEDGFPEAMHLHGRMLVRQGEYEMGMNMLKSAFNEGNFRAGASYNAFKLDSASTLIKPYYYFRILSCRFRGLWNRQWRLFAPIAIPGKGFVKPWKSPEGKTN